MAILFKKSRMQLKKFTVRRAGCEIIVGKGKLTDNTRPTFVVSVYLPPGMRRAAVDKNIDVLRDAITKMKLTERDPIIFLGGDLNKYNLDGAFEDFLDFVCVPS